MVLTHPINYDRVKLPASNRSVRLLGLVGSVAWLARGWLDRVGPPAPPPARLPARGSGFTFGLGRYTLVKPTDVAKKRGLLSADAADCRRRK